MNSESEDSQTLVAGRRADRQLVCVYLPELAVHQAGRAAGWPDAAPAALWQLQQNRQILACVSRSAGAAGLSVGMRLADARALLPEAVFAPFDPAALAGLLDRLARWAWRYSPLAGSDPAASLFWIEAGGASHLQGGPAALLADLDNRLTAAGLSGHIAMAPCYGAAFALACHAARPGQPICLSGPDFASSSGSLSGSLFGRRRALIAALSPLPVAALRLEADILAGLAQAGLHKIGPLLGQKRASLTVRFGPQLVWRRDQLLGDRDERLQPLPVEQPALVSRSWAEPISGPEALAQMITDLITDMTGLMARRQLQCRLLEIGWQRVDGQCGSQHFALSRPTRAASLLRRLTADLACHIDAGFGIEYGWARAGRLSFGLPENLQLDRRPSPSSLLDDLVDHLSARLGSEKIRRLQPVRQWQPDKAQQSLPAAALDQPPLWALPGPDSLSAPRPLRLLSPPEQLEATALLPDHAPRLLRWRGQNWVVQRASGPERIGPPWWQTSQPARRSTDYYRLETENGARLWVGRHGLPERGEQAEWFLHGFFA
jgi:protein ImuB